MRCWLNCFRVFFRVFALCTLFFATYFLSFHSAMAASGESPVQEKEEAKLDEEKLDLFSVVTEVPRTSLLTMKESFTRETVWPWIGILSSTALTYHYDQDILDGVQEFGREVGLGNEDNTKTVWRAGPYPLLRLPTDTGSSLYFFGDGWVHVGTAVGFLLTGYWGEFTRPWNTGLQLFHGMFVSTLFSQAIKRATGRESPTEQTTDRGAWRPFPSINAYNKHTARYDAYPSGHIMTATLTFTILAENYPEHSYWIFPLEVTWLTLLGLQMINNGVHWASDYPLGIAMGYQIGKISSRMGKTKGNEKRGETQSLFKNSFFYTGLVDNTPTFNVFISY